MSKLEFNIYQEYDCYDCLMTFQELSRIENGRVPDVIYIVSNLNDCPEDAIIKRSLVSAEWIIDFIKYGMRLNEQGYTADDIVVTYTTEEKRKPVNWR